VRPIHLEDLKLASVRILILTLLSVVSACGRVDYEAAPVGRFSGSLFVMWVDEGGPLGDGSFVYVPSPNARLTFKRGGALPFDTIRPEMMYTDGGSIPKVAQLFEGFSPWGYAPAYMVHDWLYVARHCNLDGTATAEEQRMNGMDFQTSADIIAEAIKTLVASDRISKNDVAPRVISSVVAGPVSREIWERSEACEAARVSDADRMAAEASIPGSSVPLTGIQRQLPDGTTTPVEAARVVAQIRF